MSELSLQGDENQLIFTIPYSKDRKWHICTKNGRRVQGGKAACFELKTTADIITALKVTSSELKTMIITTQKVTELTTVIISCFVVVLSCRGPCSPEILWIVLPSAPAP